MKTKHLLLPAALLGATGIAMASQPHLFPFLGGGQRASEAITEALRSSSLQEAEADYWLAVARATNDPDGNLMRRIYEAVEEHDETIELTEEQAEERQRASEILGHGRYVPDLDPDDFSATITNTYLMFVPGRTMIYEGMTAEGLERIEVTTLTTTRDIDGIPCAEVRDIAILDGEVIEETIDWYAEDTLGNVWYMGEIAKNFDEDGFLEDLDGSWRTGLDGAQPGIVAFGAPVVGTHYRQEYLPGEAEDLGKIVSLTETITVPYGTFTNCMMTLDGTPMEPGVVEWKYYAPGVGLILEVNEETGERLELIQVQ